MLAVTPRISTSSRFCRSARTFAVAPHFHAHRLCQLEIVAQRLVVLPGDVAVTAGRLQQFLGIADDGKLMDQKDVRSQVGDAAGEIAVHPADESDHQDERGDRQDNAQQHEKRTQLVRAHGLQRDQRRLAEEAAVTKRALRDGRIHAPNRWVWVSLRPPPTPARL